MCPTPFKFIPVALLALGAHAPAALAQQAPSVAERLHHSAVSSFRQARFPEAFGRFIALADAGHAPSAEMALWMYRHGPSVFGSDWDTSQEQLTAWARLARQPVPALGERAPAKALAPVASRKH
ncbi:hypothetical protein ACPOLB_01650 [Rubrivivax sp. RP6-9]|uniref:hypothetical protein n=1 Tax=Rubrivivax sp. RP6-9 TaxID=3415750 RepID=UPI003CC6AFBF